MASPVFFLILGINLHVCTLFTIYISDSEDHPTFLMFDKKSGVFQYCRTEIDIQPIIYSSIKIWSLQLTKVRLWGTEQASLNQTVCCYFQRNFHRWRWWWIFLPLPGEWGCSPSPSPSWLGRWSCPRARGSRYPHQRSPGTWLASGFCGSTESFPPENWNRTLRMLLKNICFGLSPGQGNIVDCLVVNVSIVAVLVLHVQVFHSVSRIVRGHHHLKSQSSHLVRGLGGIFWHSIETTP